nr:hypothetical protein [Candidatus Brocadiales bacterium]
MHWITMLGIALIAVGAFLTFFGQNIKNRFEDKHLYHSISEQTFQIDELISGNNSLLTKIDDYQKTLSEKDKIIQQLEAQISETNVIEPGQIKDEQLGARDDGLDATSSEQPANKQTEAVTQDIPEPGLNDIMAQAKSLCDEGKYDEAYKIA